MFIQLWETLQVECRGVYPGKRLYFTPLQISFTNSSHWTLLEITFSHKLIEHIVKNHKLLFIKFSQKYLNKTFKTKKLKFNKEATKYQKLLKITVHTLSTTFDGDQKREYLKLAGLGDKLWQCQNQIVIANSYSDYTWKPKWWTF